jgi:rhodanese-related sulfurtransferase/DNA-binding MarR family transcriptional regulator
MSSQSPNPECALLEQFAAVAKALGHGHRLALLQLLAQGERSVEALARLADLTVANASQHLQHLRRAGLVAARKDGKRVLYRLADEAVVTLMRTLRGIAERNLAEVERIVASYFRGRDQLEPVSARELTRRMRDGLVTVVDVRPAEEFLAGHIPGALNIPVNELGRRIKELPAAQEVVAYCRGPYCVLSYEAVSLLRRRGFKARRLAVGYPEWKAAGHPLKVGRSRLRREGADQMIERT